MIKLSLPIMIIVTYSYKPACSAMSDLFSTGETTVLETKNKDGGQSVHMHTLICTFVVPICKIMFSFR